MATKASGILSEYKWPRLLGGATAYAYAIVLSVAGGPPGAPSLVWRWGAPTSAGRLQLGASADVCVYDPSTIWPVHAQNLRSQCKHTPFAFDIGGTALPGAVRATWVGGRPVFRAP
jgi:hypothetical protein